MKKPQFLHPRWVTIQILVISCHNIGICLEFHRETTGVVFSAYSKRNESGRIPDWKSYTIHEMKAMLEVVSSKFTRVATAGVGGDNVRFKPNDTYQVSNGQVLAAEAAAWINLDKGEKNLTMLIGIWLSDNHEQMKTEIHLALESAYLANSIFEGTVEGFVFSQLDFHHNVNRAREALSGIRDIKDSTSMKIGTRQQCHGIGRGEKDGSELFSIRRLIVEESDFIICEVKVPEHILATGAEEGYLEVVQQRLMDWQGIFQILNPNIEVMGQTGWAHRGTQPWNTVKNVEKYWKEVDEWGAAENFTIWMNEAFDNPWNIRAPHNGWWRLKENALANQTYGYVENVVEPELGERPEGEEGSPEPDIWIYIGSGVALIVIAGVVLGFACMHSRIRKLQAALTKEDVKEFLDGLSDEAVVKQGGDAACPSALKFPYDKSYEIPKEKLKISMDSMLGSGQFGYVFKALIEKEEKIEVALKMTKDNCPKSALLGLLSEIKILTYLGKHPNIVSMQGAYTAELMQGIAYVATELCSEGALEGYLRKNPFHGSNMRYSAAPSSKCQIMESNEPGITFKDMVRWSHEIACGMEYLATKQVIHADLAARNVLLTEDKTAKITDFGLSRRLYDYTNYVKQNQEPLPWRWMAIESLKRLEFSEKSDVWSYGVTLWEIFAMGDLPYPGLSWNLDFVETLVNGLRMKCPPHATPEVYELNIMYCITNWFRFQSSILLLESTDEATLHGYDMMLSCWNMDPKERPSFKDLKLKRLIY